MKYLVFALIICLPFFIHFIVTWIKKHIFNIYEAGTLLALGDKSASDKLDEIQLSEVSMLLRADEACYFEGIGTSYSSKSIITGYKHSSYGRSVRTMKGITLRSSSGRSDAIRQTVNTAYQGRLFITNERIVFLAEHYGFDIPYDKLSDIVLYDKYLEVFSGSKFYRVFTPNTVYIRDLITLMNMCHNELYCQNRIEQLEDNTMNENNNYIQASLESTTLLANNAISKLWNSGSEADWLKALKHYDEMIDIRSVEVQELEIYINTIKSNDIKDLSVDEFYDFLYDKYFVWKFTRKDYLSSYRKHLQRYVREERLSELADIQHRLFNMNHSEIGECLKTAKEIHGLGTAGASGLLAVLFPKDFGTVDQFVVNVIRDIDGISYKDELQKINPNSISLKGGVTLIKIFREKAEALNKEFNTDFWTPRKIDMVLWAYGR